MLIRLIVFIWVFMSFAAPAFCVTMSSHQAIYQLRLVRAHGNEEMLSADGLMALNIDGALCRGWKIDFRILNDFRWNDRNKIIDSRLKTFESSDGSRLDYDQKEYVDYAAKPKVTRRLELRRTKPGAIWNGETKLPSAQEFSLPSDVILPMQHQWKLMKLAEHGERYDSSLVYDGSDGTKAYRVISFIGTRRSIPRTGPDDAQEVSKNEVSKNLEKIAYWPITISYFSTLNKTDETPAYRISLDLYENGVANNIILDYDRYVLRASLTNLTMHIQENPCR